MQSDRECCAAVGNELNKVLTRFDSVNSHSQETLENTIKNLESIQQELLKTAKSRTDMEITGMNII